MEKADPVATKKYKVKLIVYVLACDANMAEEYVRKNCKIIGSYSIVANELD